MIPVPVILESPYAALTKSGLEENLTYARRCLRDCLLRGEAPFASHLLYTQDRVLRDEAPDERRLGITAGFVWHPFATYIAYYVDRGWSPGMLLSFETSVIDLGFDFRLRSFWGRPLFPPNLPVGQLKRLSKYLTANPDNPHRASFLAPQKVDTQ